MNPVMTDPNAVRDLATDALKSVLVHSFQTMVGLDAALGAEYEHRYNGKSSRSVAGVIGWVGDWNGTGILECSPEFACRLAGLMLGAETQTLNEDALDVVAEMTNIIFGALKTEIQAALGSVGLGVPTIVYGNDVGMRSTSEAFTVVPFQIDGDSLNVKLYMTHGQEKRNPLSTFCAAPVVRGL